MRKIAIVRAMDYLPLDGVLKPLSDTPNLVNDKGSEFKFQIRKLLEEEGILEMDKYPTIEEKVEYVARTLKKYIPYTSDYNSVVLFSLNGLVPDDIEAGFANNTFSNKDIVVIDDLDYHLKNSNVISIVATDTAIQGNVKLSNDAVILIKKERYDKLSEEDKHRLKSKIKLFDGDLRKAVEDTLKEMGYIPERPLLGRSHNGFAESDTKQEIVDRIKEISITKEIPMQYHFNYALENDTLKINKVYEYHLTNFYKYLQKHLNFSDQLLYDLTDSPQMGYYIQELMKEIKKYGIDKYMELVKSYNRALELLKENDELPTPEQIVKGNLDVLKGQKK